MSSSRHNSVIPDHLITNFIGAKLDVYKDGCFVDTINVLGFSSKGGLCGQPVNNSNETKTFKYLIDNWQLIEDDPITGRPVFNSRHVYDLRLSATQ